MKSNSLCAQCGSPIHEASALRGRSVKYCSNACRQRAYRGRRSLGSDGQPDSNRAASRAPEGLLYPDPFVGRRRELREVGALLAQHRLVTLVGRAGAGKSRLAAECLPAAVGSFAKVFHVDATELDRHGPGFSSPVFSVLSRPAGTDRVQALKVGDTADSGRVLVCLDGCERRIDQTIRWVERIHSCATDQPLLLTSREPLGVQGEVVYRVEPLSLPDNAADAATTLSESGAVELFVTRARAADPHFRLGRDNLDSVVHICLRAQGIPRTVEWAAAQVGWRSVHDIRADLECPPALPLPCGGPDGRGHSTTRAETDRARPQGEERLSRLLSVFPDDFGVAAASAVCGLPVDGTPTALETLRGLESRSLLEQVSSEGDEVRFRQPAAVRRRASRFLEETEESAMAHDRLMRWLVGLAQPLHGPGFTLPTDPLPGLREADTFRHAMERAFEHGDDRAVALAPVPARWAAVNGWPSEARRTLERALVVAGPQNVYRASVLWALAVHDYERGDRGDALAWALETARTERSSGRSARLVRALGLAAICRLELGEPRAGEALCGEALDALSTLEGEHLWFSAALFTSAVLVRLGDEEGAQQMLARCQRALRDRASAGERECAALVAAQLSIVRGDVPRAERALREELDRNHDRLRRTGLVQGLAVVAGMRGRFFQALLLGEFVRRRGGTEFLPVRRWWRDALAAALSDAESACGPRQASRARELAAEITPGTLPLWLAKESYGGASLGEGEAVAALTSREREIAVLLAGGMTNRMIAAEAGISLRTAEAHVDSVRRKTGLRTRAQIGIWAFIWLGVPGIPGID
ncbi:LuxR C-terminal-related transcriptional regulator [Streptomyces sp. NPDC004539]|uniref:ATP-binding protein n=1 Tax=Streptomyces sp. NPDC004539 TaxID=3154280 RepID=UPI0033B2F17F